MEKRLDILDIIDGDKKRDGMLSRLYIARGMVICEEACYRLTAVSRWALYVL